MIPTSFKKTTCPTCNKNADFDRFNPFRPFCCERCKLIDLGKWASEEYKIPLEHPEHEDLIPDNEEKDINP